MLSQAIRIEHDLPSDLEIPAQAYNGANTLRALHNFAITGTPISAISTHICSIYF